LRVAREIERAACEELSRFAEVLVAMIAVLRELREEAAAFRAVLAGGGLFVALAAAAEVPAEVATRAKETAALLWPDGRWDPAVVERVWAAMGQHQTALTPFLQGVIARSF
jgi:hypothetical protein